MSKYILDLINNNEDLFIRDFKKIIGDLVIITKSLFLFGLIFDILIT